MKRLLPILLMIISLAGCDTPTPTELPTVTSLPPTSTIEVPPTETPTEPVPEPGTTQLLQPVTIQQIHITEGGNGFAVGSAMDEQKRLLRTDDGGYSWLDITPFEPTAADDLFQYDIAVGFFGSDHIWILPSPVDVSIEDGAVVMYSIDGGSTFQLSNPLDLTGLVESFYIGQIYFVDESHGWLLAHVGAGMNHDYLALYRTSDGGVNWQRILDPMSSDESGIHSCNKDGVFFTDDAHGWMTGTCNGVAPGVLLFKTTDGGTTWEKVALPDPDGHTELFIAEDSVCGSMQPRLDTAGDFHISVTCRLYITDQAQPVYFDYQYIPDEDGWISRPYPGGAVVYLDESNRMAVGEEWQFSDDGGEEWGSAGQVQPPILQIQYTADQLLYAVGLSDTLNLLFYSANQGKSWKEIVPGLK